MKRSYVSTFILALVLAFLYVPILIVVVYGFIPNGVSMSFFDASGNFSGFTAKWYSMIFTGSRSVGALMQSFWLSLTVAGLATLASCVIGTTSALALHRWKDRLQAIHHALVYTPLIMPDILIGISLLMLFVACQVECGFWTILIAHVTFCVSYVVMTVLARLQDFDDRIVEAAYDLGAGPWYTFFHVELPILMPGIVAGGLLAFTLSIDDVVITSFVNGAGTNTFPTYVSSMTKHSRNLPAVFALSTLMLIFTCALVGLSKLIARSNPSLKTKGKQQ
ncbi:MAG: ABC transporter permease subunit [Kiritimatiellae bacterium]|nr:ABC transporter permease subunit [Kiritimatiellia bacterium]